jgi:hypothetical protein
MALFLLFYAFSLNIYFMLILVHHPLASYKQLNTDQVFHGRKLASHVNVSQEQKTKQFKRSNNDL